MIDFDVFFMMNELHNILYESFFCPAELNQHLITMVNLIIEIEHYFGDFRVVRMMYLTIVDFKDNCILLQFFDLFIRVWINFYDCNYYDHDVNDDRGHDDHDHDGHFHDHDDHVHVLQPNYYVHDYAHDHDHGYVHNENVLHHYEESS